MDETIKHRIKQQYNRLSALLVFIANAFTLMYVGGMVYNDALWFGSVSGAFTYTILSTIADSQDLEDLVPASRKKPTAYQVPNQQPVPPNMIPFQQYQQNAAATAATAATYGTNASRRLHQPTIG